MAALHRVGFDYSINKFKQNSSSGSCSIGDYDSIESSSSSSSVVLIEESLNENNEVKRSIWDEFQEVLKCVQKSELDTLPPDAASEVDHYIYGIPKKKKMTRPFADTCFWIALMSSQDVLHKQAKSLSEQHTRIITTQEVLSEFMNFFCKRGQRFRQLAVNLVNTIEKNPNIEVIAQTSQSFDQGLSLYKDRDDKEYSFIDCISMATMQTRHISLVLTNDHHFSQEGFEVLMGNVD